MSIKRYVKCGQCGKEQDLELDGEQFVAPAVTVSESTWIVVSPTDYIGVARCPTHICSPLCLCGFSLALLVSETERKTMLHTDSIFGSPREKGGRE